MVSRRQRRRRVRRGELEWIDGERILTARLCSTASVRVRGEVNIFHECQDLGSFLKGAEMARKAQQEKGRWSYFYLLAEKQNLRFPIAAFEFPDVASQESV